MDPTQSGPQQPSDTAPGCDRTDMVQHAMQQLQDQISDLIAENKQLKSQVTDKAELESKFRRLEWAAWEYFEITRKISALSDEHHYTTPSGQTQCFYVPADHNDDDFSDVKQRRLVLQMREDLWLSWARKELQLAKEAREEDWKGCMVKMKFAAGHNRLKMQAVIDSANASGKESKRKIQKLEQQMHDRDESEKRYHQVINHLQTLMEAHPGATIVTGNAKRSSCDEMNDTAFKSTVKWLGQAEEQLRIAEEVQKTVERSAKRRKTKL